MIMEQQSISDDDVLDFLINYGVGKGSKQSDAGQMCGYSNYCPESAATPDCSSSTDVADGGWKWNDGFGHWAEQDNRQDEELSSCSEDSRVTFASHHTSQNTSGSVREKWPFRRSSKLAS
jgi:hypothetical protein